MRVLLNLYIKTVQVVFIYIDRRQRTFNHNLVVREQLFLVLKVWHKRRYCDLENVI